MEKPSSNESSDTSMIPTPPSPNEASTNSGESPKMLPIETGSIPDEPLPPPPLTEINTSSSHNRPLDPPKRTKRTPRVHETSEITLPLCSLLLGASNTSLSTCPYSPQEHLLLSKLTTTILRLKDEELASLSLDNAHLLGIINPFHSARSITPLGPLIRNSLLENTHPSGDHQHTSLRPHWLAYVVLLTRTRRIYDAGFLLSVLLLVAVSRLILADLATLTHALPQGMTGDGH